MKVKIMSHDIISSLEESINEFISNRDILVKDIKFTSETTECDEPEYAVLIMYTEAH